MAMNVYAHGFKAPADFVPPAAYPKAAITLYEMAEGFGWKAALEWQSASDGTPFLALHLTRVASASERAAFEADAYYGDRWRYKIGWHGWDAKPGTLRRRGAITGETPQHPMTGVHSITDIKAAMAAYPKTTEPHSSS